MSAPRLAIAGIHGHGHTHVEHAIDLDRLGRAYLAATIDPAPPGETYPVGHDVSHYASLYEALDADRIDVVIVCTPIATHFELASYALRHGLDVLLEKPTTASLADSKALAAIAADTGHLLQIGFQSLGSHGVPQIRDMIAAGRIGELAGVSIVGQWVRPLAYWQRSPWAGRREIDGVPVVDGVMTNPLAHSFATALAIIGQDHDGDVTQVQLDQYHVNHIEADDTSATHILTRSGIRVDSALTLCGPEEIDPLVRFHGTKGSIWFSYTADTATVRDGGGRIVEDLSFDRMILVDNLLDVRAGHGELIVPIEATYGFMDILDAVRAAPEPRPIDPAFVTWRDDDLGHHPVLNGIDAAVWTAADHGATFAELGLPWAASCMAASR